MMHAAALEYYRVSSDPNIVFRAMNPYHAFSAALLRQLETFTAHQHAEWKKELMEQQETSEGSVAGSPKNTMLVRGLLPQFLTDVQKESDWACFDDDYVMLNNSEELLFIGSAKRGEFKISNTVNLESCPILNSIMQHFVKYEVQEANIAGFKTKTIVGRVSIHELVICIIDRDGYMLQNSVVSVELKNNWLTFTTQSFKDCGRPFQKHITTYYQQLLIDAKRFAYERNDEGSN